ncbi:DUF4126 family protein [Tunturibacter psychrotolerans]|uniref:DUF4126 family protein n=1 Tax=Tunturiibacter psychrotolerans TaxID=3069686 RepID=A0AAU7ZRY6_9BACT
MAMQMMTWLFAIPLLGLVTGMRTMTAMAVLCWFAYAGHLSVDDNWAAWSGKLITAIIFSMLAIGEYIADKLPKTPNRTAPFPLVARLVVAGLIGAITAAGLNGSGMEGVILCVAGALVGTFASFLIRREIVARRGGKDWPVALIEDVSAVFCAVLAMGIVTG